MSDDREHRSPPPRDGEGREGGAHQRGPGGPGGDRRGPPDTAFLNLEMSRVMYAEAEQLAREAGRDLMREAIKSRLRERLGDQIAALARVAADDLAADILANLDIEARIEGRRRARGDLGSRISDALRSPSAPASPSAPPDEEPRKK